MFLAKISPSPPFLFLHSSLTCGCGIVSVLEPVDDVGADALEALPAVIGRETGSCGLRQLRRLITGFLGLRSSLPALTPLAWLLIGLHRFRRSNKLGLSWQCWFTWVLSGLGGLQVGCFGPGGQQGHLSLIWVFLAHVRAVDFSSLAGVAQFPQLPHHLREVVVRLLVVGPAQGGFALEVAVVSASLGLALAGDTKAGVVPWCRHHHGAGVFGLGAESDGFIPDAALLLLVIVAAVVGLSI